MKIEFIKEHPVGIKKGAIVTQVDKWCEEMIQEGYAIEVGATKKDLFETKEDKKKTKK